MSLPMRRAAMTMFPGLVRRCPAIWADRSSISSATWQWRRRTSASGDEQASAARRPLQPSASASLPKQRAARQSAVMLQLTNPAARAAPGVNDACSGRAASGRSRRRTANQLRSPGRMPWSCKRTAGDEVSPHRLTPPTSPWTLQAGSVIAASLITGLNSDLPGARDGAGHRQCVRQRDRAHLLIPQGSRLIGSYDSVVAFGQSRALVVWQRIILPDGSSIRIDNAPGERHRRLCRALRSDRSPYLAVAEGGRALDAAWRRHANLGWGSSESDLVRAVRESAQQNGARAGDQLVGRSLDVQPTLRVRPGWPLRIVATRISCCGPGGQGRAEWPSSNCPSLPDRTPIKIVIAVLPDLHDRLTAYAAAYAEHMGWRNPSPNSFPRC